MTSRIACDARPAVGAGDDTTTWGSIAMAWDFTTDPAFQEQLDWVAEFCKEEIDPVDLIFPGAAKSRDPRMKAIVDPLKQEVKDRGLWALFLDEDLGGPGLG